jgi:phage protein D
MSIAKPEAALLVNETLPGWRAPRLRVLANGEPMAGVAEAEVVSNNHFGADRFAASIALGADLWAAAPFWSSEPDILVDVQFSLDGGATFTSLVQGSVDSVVIDPITGSVHIDGRDLTASLIEARTQETFANRTASEIASLLAERHTLTPCVSPTSTPVGRYYQDEHDRITLNQFSHTTTEWDLLVFLARLENYDVFVEGSTLNFRPATQDSGIPVLLQPSDLTDLRLERSLTLARDIEVTVKSWNSRQHSAFIQKARAAGSRGARRSGGGTSQRYVFVRPNLTSDEALKLAQRKLAELTRHERVIELGMAGDLVLTPRSMIMLDGTGSDFDQTYYVDVIERRLHVNGGFTQHIRAKNTSPRTETTAPADVVDPATAQ